MTLSKLAKLAHVSVSTASKAFSMSTDISEETRELVFEAARKNNCFRKFFNAKYYRPVVTVICPEIFSRYYSLLVAALQRELEAAGCSINVSTADFSVQKTESLVSYYDRYSGSDMLIIIDEHPAPLQCEIPVICVGCKAAAAAHGIVLSYSEAIKELLLHLKSCGTERLIFIGEQKTTAKQEVFETAAGETGFPSPVIELCEERFEAGGYRAADRLIKRGLIKSSTAIVTAYDNLSIGLLRRLNEAGLSVPEDTLLAGFDNLPECEYLTPSLTSIGYENEEEARQITELVTTLLDGKESVCGRTVTAACHFRESTHPVIYEGDKI